MPLDSIKILDLSFADAVDAPGKAGYLFYHPNWLQLLSRQYGYSFLKTSGPAGEHMIFARAMGLLGPKLVSLPFSDYTMPQLEPGRVPLHVAALQRVFPGLPIQLKCAELYASSRQLRYLGQPTATACLHRVAVGNHQEQGMSSAFRRGIRKARRNGLVAAESSSADALQRFYTLFYRLRTEKLGLIPQPFSFFQLVYEQFIRQGHGFFYEVWKQQELLASAIILKAGTTLYYKWGCSSRNQLYLRPNNLLFSELLALAERWGYQYLDLGLSDLDETRGLIRFKESMGGKRSFIYSYSLYPPAYPLALENKLKGLVNDVAHMVVNYKLPADRTQGFSQALYPLFV